MPRLTLKKVNIELKKLYKDVELDQGKDIFILLVKMSNMSKNRVLVVSY